MKKLILAILIFILGASYASAQDVSSEGAADIRYRAIIYFYPKTVMPSEANITKYFRDFEHIDALPKKINKPVIAFALYPESLITRILS